MTLPWERINETLAVENIPTTLKPESRLKLALIEFTIVFVSEVGWNLVRKTGQSTIDSFGIALVTAILLFAFHSR